MNPLEEVKQTAYRTIRVINAIERGHRSPTLIAKKTGTTRQVVEYYLKLLLTKE